MNWLLFGGLGLLGVGLLLWRISKGLRQRTGLPAGRVIYSDTRAWRACTESLYAPSANISGRPDYLVQKWNHLLPVEIKSSPAPVEPYRSHVLQLAAYCLLVHESYDRRPPYGLIHYADRTFAVRYTPRLEHELLNTIEWLREDLRDGCAERSHNDAARCQACNYGVYCEQKLG